MPKLYTKTGDAGMTGLCHERISKDDPRLIVLNQSDRLSVDLGLLLHHSPELEAWITRLQSFLFDLNSAIAGVTPDEGQAETLTKDLEADIDRLCEPLPTLRNFILPQGNLASLAAHHARVSCRQLETTLVAINFPAPHTRVVINRLSDWLFASARSLAGTDIAYQKSKGTFLL